MRPEKLSVLLWVLVLFFASCAMAATMTYEYDKLNRRTKAIYPDGTVIEYSYDEAGNQKSAITKPPAVVDSDGDGLCDDDEVNIYGTDPENPDTDGDFLDDKFEIGNSPQTDPLMSLADMNRDGKFNASDINMFRNSFMAEDEAADVNCDGVINARDINDFRNAYMAAQS
jgi:YD repeat-containing protein